MLSHESQPVSLINFQTYKCYTSVTSGKLPKRQGPQAVVRKDQCQPCYQYALHGCIGLIADQLCSSIKSMQGIWGCCVCVCMYTSLSLKMKYS